MKWKEDNNIGDGGRNALEMNKLPNLEVFYWWNGTVLLKRSWSFISQWQAWSRISYQVLLKQGFSFCCQLYNPGICKSIIQAVFPSIILIIKGELWELLPYGAKPPYGLNEAKLLKSGFIVVECGMQWMSSIVSTPTGKLLKPPSIFSSLLVSSAAGVAFVWDNLYH